MIPVLLQASFLSLTQRNCAGTLAEPGQANLQVKSRLPLIQCLDGAVLQNSTSCVVTIPGIHNDNAQMLRGSYLMFSILLCFALRRPYLYIHVLSK